jgi:hypothetical protein
MRSELIKRIDEVKNELQNFEINPYKHEGSYAELIDEQGPVIVAGLEFTASRILREVDPVAYRCGLVDYVDSLDVTDDEEYQALEAELKELKDELADLENE